MPVIIYRRPRPKTRRQTLAAVEMEVILFLPNIDIGLSKRLFDAKLFKGRDRDKIEIC